MSKSITARKNAKKQAGAYKKVREKKNGYTPSRATQTAFPAKPKATASMLVRRKVLAPVRIERNEWTRVEEASTPTERATVTAHFADGSRVEYHATIAYAPGERERILMPVIAGQGGEAEVRDLQRLLFRRSRALQAAYCRAQRATITVGGRMRDPGSTTKAMDASTGLQREQVRENVAALKIGLGLLAAGATQ